MVGSNRCSTDFLKVLKSPEVVISDFVYEISVHRGYLMKNAVYNRQANRPISRF